MMSYYPTFLEAIVTFRIYSRQILAKRKGKAIIIRSILNKNPINIGETYEIDPEHEKIPTAAGYRIEKE